MSKFHLFIAIINISLIIGFFQACDSQFLASTGTSQESLTNSDTSTGDNRQNRDDLDDLDDKNTGEATRASYKSTDECENQESDWIFCNTMVAHDLKEIWGSDGLKDSPERYKFVTVAGPQGESNREVLRLRVKAGRGGTGIKQQLDNPQKKLYARWYVQYENGFNLDASNHGNGLHAGYRWKLGSSNNRPKGDDWFSAWMEHNTNNHRFYAYAYYRGMYMDCSNPVGSCWGDHFPCMLSDRYCKKDIHKPQVGKLPPEIQTGRWYCVEQMMDAGDPVTTQENANGVLNFWIDGQEIGPWKNLWLRTAESGVINGTGFPMEVMLVSLGFFHHDDKHSVEGKLFSNVVISSSRIGCLQ